MRMAPMVGLIAIGLVGVALGLTLLDELVEQDDSLAAAFAVDFLDRLIMIGAAAATAIAILRLGRLRLRADDLDRRIERAASEGRAWRDQSRRLLDGLSRAIDDQFAAWDLTLAEADIAGLLLKGASLREIAALRRTSVATIRQQASNVYRKSGLGGRTELAAYFLEDLFALSETSPRETGTSPPVVGH